MTKKASRTIPRIGREARKLWSGRGARTTMRVCSSPSGSLAATRRSSPAVSKLVASPSSGSPATSIEIVSLVELRGPTMAASSPVVDSICSSSSAAVTVATETEPIEPPSAPRRLTLATATAWPEDRASALAPAELVTSTTARPRSARAVRASPSRVESLPWLSAAARPGSAAISVAAFSAAARSVSNRFVAVRRPALMRASAFPFAESDAIWVTSTTSAIIGIATMRTKNSVSRRR